MVNTLEGKSSQSRFRLWQHTKAAASVLSDEFGVPFTFYDAATGLLLSETETTEESGSCYEPESVLSIAAADPKYVSDLDNNYRLSIPLFERGKLTTIAVGMLSSLADHPKDRLQERIRLEKWVGGVVQRLKDESHSVSHNVEPSEKQPDYAWNSVLTLDKLFRRLRVHKEPAKYRQKILDAAAEVLNVQTIFWISPNDEDPVIGGEPCLSPWDCQQLAMVIVKGMNRDEIGVRICNDAQEQSWASRCKNVSNLCVVAVNDQRLGGWAIAVNKRPARKDSEVSNTHIGEANQECLSDSSEDVVPFRRSDAAALVPFLSLLGLYSSASHRYHTLKELMVGLARSLTASIDAKDEYTFGHSERVARISMELGSELGLDDDELNDIYLAGLLHDIGKIGVPDAVLRKPGALTPEETLQIQQHPAIGHKILSGLRPIAHLLPGVLYHHERYDGKGYPEGLKGEAIPMLARIIAVADGYDAMSSSRPYRQGMPLAKVEQILEQGSGTQWDSNVIQAFFRRRQRIHAIRHHGVGESLRHALDAAIREKDDSKSDSSVTALLV